MGRSVKYLAALALGAWVALPVTACGAAARKSSPAVGDAAAAEARYRAFHRTTLAPRLGAADRRRAEGLLERKPAVERVSCRDARRTIAATDPPPPLHGSLAALERAGDCWILRWDGLLGLGLGAAVAPDGDVLLAWWMPEG